MSIYDLVTGIPELTERQEFFDELVPVAFSDSIEMKGGVSGDRISDFKASRSFPSISILQYRGTPYSLMISTDGCVAMLILCVLPPPTNLFRATNLDRCPPYLIFSSMYKSTGPPLLYGDVQNLELALEQKFAEFLL